MGKNKNTSQTKQYKIQKSRKAKKYNRDQEDEVSYNTKRKKKKKHGKLKKVILILFIIFFLLILVAGGIFAGVFFSDKWAITTEDLVSNGNTEVVDSKGKQIALLSGDANRKVISIDEMGRFTPNAYVAIEDKRFYEHSGIDIIRTANATLSYILHKGEDSSVGGGSTITQQLVKNLMKDDDDTGLAGVERKIREMSRAYRIESMLTKTQILEKYLNVIFVGGDRIHGVEYGARYYFAKSAKDLDLAESAFLAGINHAPNLYNPYSKETDNTEKIKNRTKLVLNFMKEQNRISDNPEEAEKLYNEAIAKVDKGLKFKKGDFDIGGDTYFVKTAVQQAAKDLAEAKDLADDEAEAMIVSGGYKLYTTQVTSIQNIVINEMAKDTYVEKTTVTQKDENGKSKKVTTRTNAGMTIIEPSTGKVVALGGDLQQDSGINWNYATSTRQTGSSIKPLANVAPGLEEKVITASTVYDDVRTKFPGMNTIPRNVGNSYYGLCTVRKAIERSSNVVNLKIMSNVGIGTAIDYLHEFGLTTYNKDEDRLTLAIGGATNGSSTLQMAAGYATLANGGIYIEPIFYTKLEDSNGSVVVEPKQETRRVISEANAYIVSNILIDVVKGASGTAGPCAISGMDVAAKTGTTDGAIDKWLCGYTPYYAAAVWYGYGIDTSHSVYKVNNARTIWANVMSKVHKNLEGKKFVKPDNVVTAKVCRYSGKLATSACTSTYTEYFVDGTVPKECDGHTVVKMCKQSGKVATQYCPETQDKVYTSKPEKELNAKWTPTSGSSKYNVPTEKCTVHTEETNKVTVVNVVGKSEADAKVALSGLNVQVIYETHSDMENGVVLKQSLLEGTVVDKGVSIVITVNKTSNTVTPPPSTTTPTEPPTSTQTTPQAPTNTEKPSETNTQTPSTNSAENTNTVNNT